MAIKVSETEAEDDLVANASVRRYMRRTGPAGIGVGVSMFRPLSPGVDPRSVWESHDVPEIHYVLSGRGVILEEAQEIRLQPGDVVITPPGARHVLWGESEDEPLTTFYAAVSRNARS